jgi:Holliday junction resolvase
VINVAAEKTYENKIEKYLKSKGCYCVKYFGCMYSTSGTPDILACVKGYFLAIEVKAQNGNPSALQIEHIKQIRKAGGIAYIAYPSGWDKMRDIIDGLLEDRFNLDDEVELK